MAQMKYSWGKSMRKARLDAGLEASELASLSGVSKSTIQNYEWGVSNPTLFNLVCITDVLGISIDEYIGHEVKEK